MKPKKKKTRRKYTEEFKREAVRLVETRGERTVADVAASLGVAENLLHGWRQRFADTAEQVRQERGETPEEELKRLRREVGRLKQERDILEKAANYQVAIMCDVLDVSRSGYYAWLERGPSERTRQDEQLTVKIRAIHEEHRERYGSPRIHAELAANDTRAGQKRVARLMRENGLKGRPRKCFKRTTDSEHKHPIAANLLAQDFSANRPDEAWAGDITYIWLRARRLALTTSTMLSHCWLLQPTARRPLPLCQGVPLLTSVP